MKLNFMGMAGGAVALILAAANQPAHADTVYDYTVAGTYSGGTLSGTLDFDATTGLVTSASIDASSIGTFSSIFPGQGQPFFSPDDYFVTIAGAPNTIQGIGLGLDTFASLSAGQTTDIASFTSFTQTPTDANSFSGTLYNCGRP
jgi:hypothetical protein